MGLRRRGRAEGENLTGEILSLHKKDRRYPVLFCYLKPLSIIAHAFCSLIIFQQCVTETIVKNVFIDF